jgi:hypothetical protein
VIDRGKKHGRKKFKIKSIELNKSARQVQMKVPASRKNKARWTENSIGPNVRINIQIRMCNGPTPWIL